jgi:hypothetical protein
MGITGPNRRLHHLGLELALVLSLVVLLAHPGEVAADEASLMRVRSTDSTIATLIDLAATRSLTFRNLVSLIQASDGIVYVEPGDCGHGTRACLKLWMQASGSTRFLRVVVSRRRGSSDMEFLGSIGHELQHSVEALSEPATVDSLGLFNFFSRAAVFGNNRFETVAAISAGDAVRKELGNFRTR